MKRMFGLIICSGILFALSGCSASIVKDTALPTARPIVKVTSSSSNSQSNTAAVASPIPTIVAPTAPDQSAANGSSVNATTTNKASTMSSPLPTPAGQAPTKSGQPQLMPGVMGTVTAVDGSTITIQDSRQQSTVTVILTDNTQVFKQTTIALADVSVGETLSALGNLNDDVFTAAQIRIGVEAAPTDMPQPNGVGQPGGNPPDSGQVPSGEQPPAGGQPPADGQPPSGAQPSANGQARPNGQLLFGTVTAVSSDALTIKTASGSTVQVQLGANGQMTRQVAGTSADIVTGVQIMARGEQSNATITATRIDIMPALS
jgi:hypothetical protein